MGLLCTFGGATHRREWTRRPWPNLATIGQRYLMLPACATSWRGSRPVAARSGVADRHHNPAADSSASGNACRADLRLVAAARARRSGGCADGADLYHTTRLRPWIFLPRAPRQRPSRAVLLAADADALRPVAAPPCATPRRLKRPRPAQRSRTRHILILPHGRRVQWPRHLASATPSHRQASRNQPVGATSANFSGAVSLSVRRAAHLARGTAQRTPY